MSRVRIPADPGGDVRERLREAGVGSGDRLVVACSGGIDSVTLLHLLRFEGGHDRHALVVAHFDHRMRPDSAADAAWVRGLCLGWGLPLREGSAAVDIAGETEARRARWRFLEETAADLGAVGIVTAHHADDQVETVVHHLLRGTGPRGMAGMALRDGLRIRPLLEVDRAAIEGWAEARRLPVRVDPSNAVPANPRNHLRLEGLPLLEAIRPGAARGILRSARLAGRAEAGLTEAEDLILPTLVIRSAPRRLTVDLEGLRGLGPALRERLIRRLARMVGGRLDEAGTRAAVEFTIARSGGGTCRLAGGIVLRRSLGELEVEGSAEVDTPARAETTLDVPGRGRGAAEVSIGGERWRVRWGGEASPGPWSAAFTLDPGAFPLRVRAWRAGDRVLDGRRERLVARIWSAQGVPLHERSRRPVVEDGRGRLLWVPGSGLVRGAGEASTAPFYLEIARVDNH